MEGYMAVCIEDFCGRDNTGPVAFWADWHPDKGRVEFGGDWHNVPDMPATERPTVEQVHAWAKQHGGTTCTCRVCEDDAADALALALALRTVKR